MMKESLTVKETSELLNISEQTIRRMMKAGKIEYFKIGSNYRIKKDSIDLIMNQKDG